MQRLSLFLIAAILLALIAFNFALAALDRSTPLAPVEAQNATLQNPVVRIDPAQSVVGVSDTFTVTVMIDHASNLGGFEFDLLYITTTVTVDGVTLGDFLGSTGRFVGFLPPTIDNQNGKVAFVAFSYDDASGPNGTGALALVSLTAQGEGESPLDLQNVKVAGADAKSQVVTDEDGTVWVGTTPPTVTSTPTATSTATVTATPTPTSTGAATPTPTATSTVTATGTPPTPTSTATATPTLEPVIVVYPTKAPVGETFTFTGSHFTPDGRIDAWFTAPSQPPASLTWLPELGNSLIKEWLADPDQTRYFLDSFYADSSGGFTYQHNWEKYWPAGIYSFIAIDVARESETSVEFEMTEPLAQTPTSTPTSTATATATPTTTPTPTATPYRLYLPLVLKE